MNGHHRTVPISPKAGNGTAGRMGLCSRSQGWRTCVIREYKTKDTALPPAPLNFRVNR